MSIHHHFKRHAPDSMCLLFPQLFHVEKKNLLQSIPTLKLQFMKAQELVSIYLGPLELERQQQFEKSLHSSTHLLWQTN